MEQEENKIMNQGIWKKFLEVKKQVPYLQNDKQGFGYMYTSTPKVLSTINRLTNELGLMLTATIMEAHSERVLKKKKVTNGNTVTYIDNYETLYNLDLIMTWTDVETGEVENFKWFGAGLNGDEMGFGSALTYSKRYFLINFFNIPTDELDPEEVEKLRYSEEKGRVDLSEKIEEQKIHDGLGPAKIETPVAKIGEKVPTKLVEEGATGKIYTREELDEYNDWKDLLPIIEEIGGDRDDIGGRISKGKAIEYILGMQLVKEEDAEKETVIIDKPQPEKDQAKQIPEKYQKDYAELMMDTDFISNLDDENGKRGRHSALRIVNTFKDTFGISTNMCEKYNEELFGDKFKQLDDLVYFGTKDELITVLEHHRENG